MTPPLVPQGTFLTSSVCSVVWGGKNISSILRIRSVKELLVPEANLWRTTET